MAEKLMKYYQYANEKGGMALKVKLAQETKVPSTRAALEPDSPDTVQKFRTALKTLTGSDAPVF